MSVEVVREVADVERVAVGLGLTPTDAGVSTVYGQWSCPGVIVTAVWDAPEWTRVAVQGRRRDGRQESLTRVEAGAAVATVRGHIELALALFAAGAVAA